MCGIIGYIGSTDKAIEVILDGLSKMEYRGYDSSGIAVVDGGKIFIDKKMGRLQNLIDTLPHDKKASVGLGHTRWATHGVPSDRNAHPFVSYDDTVAVVHNGIIENFIPLKKELMDAGVKFTSDTDTEVVAHLFAKLYNGDMLATMIKLKDIIRGSYALGIVDANEPDKLICSRKASPLVIGLGDGKNYIASDIPAILNYTRDIVFLEDEEIAVIERDKVSVYDKSGKPVHRDPVHIEWNMEEATKGGYPHFMLKEIEEQPNVVEKTLGAYIDIDGRVHFDEIAEKCDISKFKEIYFVACGTAHYACLQGAYFLKKIANVKVTCDIASEFRYTDPWVDKDTLVVFVSQSGETLDTLEALRLSKAKGATTMAITNVLGSTISREADMVIYTVAGPEISVASTKAYTAQVVMLYLFAIYMADKKGFISDTEYDKYLDIVHELSQNIALILSKQDSIKEIAEHIKGSEHGFYLGRTIDEKAAREGALKMKEISYMHTESFPAGELKHGTIALIEEGTPVIVIATQRDMVEKMISNIKEVKARGAFVIAVTKETFTEISENADRTIIIPDMDDILSAMLAVIPLQLLAYYVASGKGLDVDKPRNLAKSVTVE